MKKLILFMSVAVIAFYGCEKSELNPSFEKQEVEKSNVAAFVLNLDGETPTYEAIYLSQDELQGKADLYKGSNSAHTHGNFHTSSGSSFTFNGTQNNGGSHGSGEYQSSSPFGDVHVIMETVSVVVDGDEAIYGGVISEVILNTLVVPPPPGVPPPPPPPTPFLLGSHVYFKVLDNGQGNNAPADQYHGVVFSITNPIPGGGAGLPWFFSTFFDVANESDKIKVNK